MEGPEDLLDGHLHDAGDDVDLRCGEAVDVDRMMLLDVAEQIHVPVELQVGVVTPLHQDLDGAQLLRLVDLGADLLVRQRVGLGVLGPAVERAEVAVGDADVRVVDVAVDDVGDHVVGMALRAGPVGQAAQLQGRRVPVEREPVLDLPPADAQVATDVEQRHQNSRTAL